MSDQGAVYDSRRQVAPHAHERPTTERVWVRRTLIGIALLFMALVLVLPLVLVFVEAFRKGAEVYFAAFEDPQTVCQPLLDRLGRKAMLAFEVVSTPAIL